ncbi:hypothetical protein ACFYWX_10700 [Streptomyces sp. NPDC002888]|uniref:hypothetical protein n=1 Tax=Streptomyces sp. NPDC002888 TaxID=3364668 RepID=UPI0036B85008
MALHGVQEAAVVLPDPGLSDPAPTPGCGVCAALYRQGTDARNPKSPNYDLSKASDYFVELRRHHSNPEGMK